jgi:hypothetical protein
MIAGKNRKYDSWKKTPSFLKLVSKNILCCPQHALWSRFKLSSKIDILRP